MYFDANYTNSLRTNLVKSKSKNKNGLETITKFLICDKAGVKVGFSHKTHTSIKI